MYEKFKSALRHLWFSQEGKIAWRNVWGAHRGWSVMVMAVVSINSIASILSLVMIGLVTASVPPAVRQGAGSPEARLLLTYLVLFGMISLATAGLGRFIGLARERLQTKVIRATEERLLSVSLRPEGILHLETPSFADEIALIRGEMNQVWVGAVVGMVVTTLQQRLTALFAVIIVAAYALWAPVLLIISAVILWRFLKKVFINLYKGWVRDASHLRRASYLRDLTLTPPAAKEVRVFGLTKWITESFRTSWLSGMAAVWKERRELRWQILGTSGVVGLSVAFVATMAARSAIRGEIGLAQTLIIVQSAISIVVAGAYDNDHIFGWAAAGALGRLQRLERHEALGIPDLKTGPVDVPDRAPEREIALDGVSFSYPGTDQAILKELNLTISPGTSVAIVGENGAGKTTLVKLLARLYDVDGGVIKIDGLDIRDLNLEQWRQRVAIIFQDFARYQLSLRDNVAFGRLSQSDDDLEILNAIEAAQAGNLLERLPDGLDTILSAGYEGGTDLSGGEWQKVALARALFAVSGGGLLILDEPTANLDVRAEAELFNRFLHLTRGKTTILISHRFSSVRRAQRIIVLDSGRVAEDGSHAELMSMNGLYARMYSLQADQFVDAKEAADA